MPIVRVCGLSYAYPDGRTALREVSFSVEAGERVAILGPNGAGKSTLLLHLAGVLPERFPAANGDGRGVWIGEHAVRPPNLGAIRAAVGLLFQDPDDQLFCPSVLEDVAFGPLNRGVEPREAVRLAREAMAAVGISPELEDRPPHRLSLGEKRRACLAGVLACAPAVLALDEPTSNLDPRGRRQLLRILAARAETLLVASHDLEMVRELCGRAIVLDEGVIHADGPAEAVLLDETLLEAHGLEVPRGLGPRD